MNVLEEMEGIESGAQKEEESKKCANTNAFVRRGNRRLSEFVHFLMLRVETVVFN